MTDILIAGAALFLIALGLACRWVKQMGRKW